MKKFGITVIILCLHLGAWAYSFSKDNIFYNLISPYPYTTYYAEVTNASNSYNSYSGKVIIPSTVSYNGTEYSVKSIGSYAFYGCSGLTSITIPTSVTNLGNYAFQGCNGLTSITIPPSVTSISGFVFLQCSNLISVNLPPSITRIDLGAFWECTKLTSFTIPPLVTSLESNFLSGCTSLSSITIPSTVTTIANGVFSDFSGNIVIDPNNAYFSIKDGVLYDKKFTRLITCPTSKIGIFNIPSTVTSIGSEAFNGCAGLSNILIPSSVTSIGYNAFSGCNGISSIYIPSSVLTIEFLQNFPGQINVDPDNPNYSSKDGILYDKQKTLLIKCPTSYTGDFNIPTTITSIKSSAFASCSGITAISIPSSISTIDQSTFDGCTGLTSLIIPSSITTIGQNAFANCTGLKSLTIPSSVCLNDGSFSNCTGLTAIYSYIKNPYTTYPFSGINKATCKLYVPIGTSALYKAAPSWNEFSNIIEALIVEGSAFSVDGVNYTCNGMNTVSISGVANFSGSTIPAKVNYLGVDYSINAIGNSVFEYNQNFTDIVVPSNITTIGNYTFNSCTALRKIEFPAELQSIGDYALYNCTDLSEIKVNSAIPAMLGSSVFYGVDKTQSTLYVPRGSLAAYKSATQWKDFLTMVEFDPTSIDGIKVQALKLYPNLTSTYINIDVGDSNESHQLKIYNQSGQKVFESNVTSKHYKINVSNLPIGLYFIQLMDAKTQNIQLGRFVKK